MRLGLICAYSETCQTSKIELFAKIDHNSILDIWQGSEYASDKRVNNVIKPEKVLPICK